MTTANENAVGKLSEVEYDEKFAEHAFLLMAQTQIQKLLNEKGLRYAELSRRLGVSEARVSQMFGDEASNLTLRTIARVFHKLGEKPVIMSEREKRRLEGLANEAAYDAEPLWSVSGLIADYLHVNADVEAAIDDATAQAVRPATRSRAWALSDAAAAQRAHAA